MDTQPYEHLSPAIHQWMERKDCWGATEAQNLIRQKIAPDGTITTDTPLERILAIVEKHKQPALERHVDLRGLNAYHTDKEGYRVNGQCSPEYRAFTQEMLEAGNFPYTAREASLVGTYQRGNNGEDITDVIIDRILLRKALTGVEDPIMRENIWYALTLHDNNRDAMKYLRERYTDGAADVLHAMTTTVLPQYTQFLAEVGQDTQPDRGTRINGRIAHMRQKFIKSIGEILDYETKSDAGSRIEMKR